MENTNTSILLSEPSLDAPWAYTVLRSILSREDTVCVLALSFFEDTKSEHDWNIQYGSQQGIEYRQIVVAFARYGIAEHQMEWIDPFSDTKKEMVEKISKSTILYIPGGSPTALMARIRQFRLKKILKNYQGTVIGISAGAMVQLETYHITPDDDFPNFSYEKGIGLLDGFFIEMHYARRAHQTRSIERVLEDRKMPLYAIGDRGGLLVKNGKITAFGDVSWFE